MTKEEAINKVRQMSLPKETMEILQALAPELKESDDERIRLFICGLITRIFWGKDWDISKKDCLAYLEKQKPAWSEEDERIRRELVEYLKGDLDDITTDDTDRWINWLEKQKETLRDFIDNFPYSDEQKEQKPKLYWHKIKAYEKLPCKAYLYKQAFEQENNFFGKATIPGFMAPNIPCEIGCDTWHLPVDDVKNLPKEGEDEQKPAEWSEEDENKIESIKALITTGRFADTNTIRTIWELLDSLSPQPKQEWSEEDEKKIIFLERLIEHNVPDGQYGWADGRKGGFVTKSEAISMLKSLRPQPKRDCKDCAMFLNGECTKPSWKPSEEQMKALLNAEGYLREGDQFDSAKSIAQLYEQLKRL